MWAYEGLWCKILPGRADQRAIVEELPPPPAAGASPDSVLLVFAAHELRPAADRAALFAEAARVLRPGGRLVPVEHLRDTANTALVGPGPWHFRPRATRLGHAAAAGPRPVAGRRIGGLVTAFAFRRPGA
ncbi:methyltransferase domain-containing protein [Kitasatospora sp. NPDC056327]|uniref:methyltransferase domain-containing protein n=1 Tax=Kitasatospora sp. NPDC056327 TaxID=3345785 RepID=UPI0035DD3C3A